jgi:DNA invertase Pin-like site-specific DNA recombinase
MYAIVMTKKNITSGQKSKSIIKNENDAIKGVSRCKLTIAQLTEIKQKRSNGGLIKDIMLDYGLSKLNVYRIFEEDQKIFIIKQKHQNGISIKRIMSEYGLSKPSVYRILSQ